MFSVRIQTAPIALAELDAESIKWSSHDSGAALRFVGRVRNDAHAAPITHLVLDHFPGVAEAEIEKILASARDRWALQGAQVVHRVGKIPVGEIIVVVETASAHRHDAYEANAFIMDYLKTRAPFWKQECFADGSARWVEARARDQVAARRWEEIE